MASYAGELTKNMDKVSPVEWQGGLVVNSKNGGRGPAVYDHPRPRSLPRIGARWALRDGKSL